MSPNGRAAEVAPRTLLGRLRAAVRARHYSPRTEESYVGWVKRFVVFHGRRHPDQLGEAEVRAFLEHLAEQVRVSASTQNQAVAALLFLYEAVLGRRLAVSPQGIVHAKELQRLPVVLSREEVRAVLAQLRGVARLVGLLLHGSGLRLVECLSLRVKDVDFHRGEIRVRGGKGGVDRVVPLPVRVQGPLADHLGRWRARHARDVERGGGRVALPGAFERKAAGSATEWAWQWVFPAQRTHRDPGSGGRSGGIICTSLPFSVPCGMRYAVRGSRSARPVTRFATRSLLISSRRVPISGRCRSCWGIATCARP